MSGECEQELCLSDLCGKVMLVGFTYYTHDHKLIERKQYYGEIIEANEHGIIIRKPDGELLSLPPDLRSTHRAQPGEYRLRSTGEVVVDPDFLARWNVTKPENPREGE